jgi:hypothetical protein
MELQYASRGFLRPVNNEQRQNSCPDGHGMAEMNEEDIVNKTYKTTDRLTQMWEDLLANPVAPEPPARAGMSLNVAAGRDSLPLLRMPEIPPENSIILRTSPAQEVEWIVPVPLKGAEPEGFIPVQVEPAGPVRKTWKESLGNFFESLVELANTKAPFSVEAASPDAPAAMTLEVAHEESLSYSSPFRWEPKPSWISAPVQTNPRSPNMTDVERLVFKPKIPLRPLHKQRFYRRFFFYLRRWLGTKFQKAT